MDLDNLQRRLDLVARDSKLEPSLLAHFGQWVRRATDEELFKIERVSVRVPEQDQPGRPVSRVFCDECGEGINDRREVVREERTLCRACAGEAYFSRL